MGRRAVPLTREHPVSRQRENAMLRLAQLQIAKGDPRSALGWLSALYKEYPRSAQDGERQYWTVRALLANGDTARACAVTGSVTRDDAAAFGPEHQGLTRDCASFAERVRLDSAVVASRTDSSAMVRPAGAPAQPDSQP